MATYIGGMTDVIPQIQPFQPDFGLIQKTLANRQNRFDQGFASLKNVYNQVLNAPLTDPANMAIRDEYIRTAEKKLKDLSAVDLSLSENQQAAEQVFAPFWQDDLILQDASTTRWYQAEIQKALTTRDHSDEKIRSQYNDLTVRYLQNGLEKLKNAGRDKDQYARLERRRFIPWRNLEEHLHEQAQKAGLKIEYSSDRGPYLVSTTNGPQSVPAFETFAHNVLGNNFVEQFRMMGTVEKEERLRLLRGQLPGLGEKEGLSLMAKDYYTELEEGYQKQEESLQSDRNTVQSRIAAFEKLPTLLPAQVTAYENLLQQNQALEEMDKKARKQFSDFRRDKDKTLQDIITNPEGYFASVMKQRVVNGWANARAAGQQIKLDINPVWKESNLTDYHNAQLDIDRQQLALDEKEYELDKWKAENDVDGTGSGKKNAKTGTNTNPQNAGLFDGAGSTDVTKVGNAYQVFIERQQQRWGMAHQELFNITRGVGSILHTMGVSDPDAVRYMDMMREFSMNPAVGGKFSTDDMKFFRRIGEKLKDKTGIDAGTGFYNARSALLEAARINLTGKLQLGSTGITNDDAAMLMSYSTATQALQEYTTLEEERKSLVQKTIINNPDTYRTILTRRGNSTDISTVEDVVKDFRPLTLMDKATKEKITLSPKEFAEAYLNGDFHYSGAAGSFGDLYLGNKLFTIDGFDGQTGVAGIRSFNRFYNEKRLPFDTQDPNSLLYKYGTSEEQKKLRDEVNQQVIPNLSEYQNETGKMGFVIRYDLSDKTRGDVGARLIQESSLPANYETIYVNGQPSLSDGKLNNSILTLSSMGEDELEKYISTSLLKTVGPTGRPSLVVKFKPMKDNDRTEVNDFVLADLAGKEIEFVLKPNPTGDTLRRIKYNPGYYIYGSLLRGKPIHSDPMLRAAGFSFQVTPDSQRSPQNAIVSIERKEFKNGSYEPASAYREEFSFAEKTPDEIMSFMYSLFSQHLVRNVAAQSTFLQQNKQQLPTPASVKENFLSTQLTLPTQK